jgi:hypothetical protein
LLAWWSQVLHPGYCLWRPILHDQCRAAASEAFQQLQGQVALLRDMLKNALLEEKEQPKKDTEPTKEQTTEEEK